MGFGLSGIKPRNEKGIDFGLSAWYWRPIWNFVCEACTGIVNNEDAERGHYNDGHIIDEEKSKKIAIRLEFLINQGELKRYAKEHKEALDCMADETCKLCKGTGFRNDEIYRGKCNRCLGKGKVRPDECQYPFDEESVKLFAEFCRYSGGFKIW